MADVGQASPEEDQPPIVVDLAESEESDVTKQADETVTTRAAETAATAAAAALRHRRSSVGHSIRRSQSTTNGLTFEDQLLVIADNDGMSARDKLTKLVNLSVTATCRALLKENDQLINLKPGSSDDRRADLIDTLASALGQRELLQETHLELLAQVTGKLALASSTSDLKTPEVMSSRLRQLKNYVQSLREERDNWSALRQSRKNRFHLVRSERQAVMRGETCVTGAQRSDLTSYEDAWLRGISDGTGELERMKKQATDLANARNKLCDKMVRKRKVLDDLNCELDGMIRQIDATAKRVIVGKDSTAHDVGDQDNLAAIVQTRKSESIPDTEFGAEVKAWIADMQAA